MLRGHWWSAKIRRTWAYLHANVSVSERAELEGWLTARQLRLFDWMHVADRRHGLDVVADLHAEGVVDLDLLVAGLLHDAGKGPRVRLVHRVAYSLGQRYGEGIWTVSERMPTFRIGLTRLRDHAARSADLAREAGCSSRTVELIRNQEVPTDDAGRQLLAADEAN
jgi:hypothetical protein